MSDDGICEKREGIEGRESEKERREGGTSRETGAECVLVPLPAGCVSKWNIC